MSTAVELKPGTCNVQWDGTQGGRCTDTQTEIESDLGLLFLGHDYTNPVTVRFSQPVYELNVFGLGVYVCADYGQVTATGPAGSTTIALTPVDPEDCPRGEEDGGVQRTNATYVEFPPDFPVTSVTITVMSPLEYPRECQWWETGPCIDFAGASYTVGFREPLATQTRSLTLVRAEGPHGGSFTTLPGENVISLEATVTPADLGSQVRWEIRDAPGDHVTSTPPTTLPTGPVTSFIVPDQDPDRWASVGHDATLLDKSLAYEVTAAVDASGTALRSSPTMVQQDEIDTARQEYIDLGPWRGVPARAQFTTETRRDPGLNTGDYGVMVWNNDFVAHVDNLAFTFSAQWQINSQYRNPVHQRFHLGKQLMTWHLYGCAADLQTFPTDRSRIADSLAAEAYWGDLATLARRLGFVVEARSASGVGHVHVERRC